VHPSNHASWGWSLCSSARSTFWASTATLTTTVTSYHWNGISTLLPCKLHFSQLFHYF
jgi:hypothetical protein